MRDKKVLEMTTLAIFIAVIFVMGLIPFVGFIPIFGTTVTTLHVPVIIGAIYGGRRFGGPKFGLLLGLSFGVISFLRSFLPFFPLDALFQNPVIAILPRMIFGFASWYIYVGITKLISEVKIALPIVFILGTLVHTVLVLSVALLMLGFYREFLGELANFLIIILPVNGTFEVIVAALIGSGVMVRLLKYDETQALQND